ncbi:MAG: methionyl-tRNA formyltransferase [Lachnospiraceae bacterium]|nr:methionyl-tRNA formyltransferase [Lachnospiraceae bacterium]
MKIVFMGTPDYAVGALDALYRAGHDIVAVVTQPDKAKGRSDKPVYSPVKAYAVEKQIPVLQPVRIKRPEAVEELQKIPADVFVVAAFGQILSKEILKMPKFGCLNIHASLLPKYRGSSPIQWAVINGEEKSGVTIMQMNEGVDTGDILYMKEIPLDKKETGASLFDKLAALGAEAIVEALSLLEAGKLKPVPQNEAEASHTVMLNKAMGQLDFSKSAQELERLIRGLNSWPSAYTFLEGKQLKIWEAEIYVPEKGEEEAVYGQNPIGSIIKVMPDGFVIKCGKDALLVRELQLEGKKRMSTRDFLMGKELLPGTVLE